MNKELTEAVALFYAFDLRDGSVWAITKYDISENNRLGWLNGYCVHVGSNTDNYIGADIGIDAKWVLTSPDWDISANYQNKTP